MRLYFPTHATQKRGRCVLGRSHGRSLGRSFESNTCPRQRDKALFRLFFRLYFRALICDRPSTKHTSLFPTNFSFSPIDGNPACLKKRFVPEYFNAGQIFETWVGSFIPPLESQDATLLRFSFPDPILVELLVISRAVQRVQGTFFHQRKLRLKANPMPEQRIYPCLICLSTLDAFPTLLRAKTSSIPPLFGSDPTDHPP
jgi:hypothetical protein